MSNSRRQEITFGQFLAEHDAQSPSAYADYSNRVLQQKLEKLLGASSQKGDIIDWEVDGVRTSPIDHTTEMDSDFLQQVMSGKEKLNPIDETVRVID